VRPELIVGVLGTGTEVGKTWVGARLVGAFRQQGLTVAARKPVQSFDPADPAPTDAEVLAAATGEAVEDVCPSHRCLPLAMAPPMAADRLALPPFTVADLCAEVDWPAGTDVGLVETVGGPCSPVAADGDSLDLMVSLWPDVVVLVADAGLGTINAVELCRRTVPLRPLVILLNRFDAADPLHAGNLVWLRRDLGTTVVADTASAASACLAVSSRSS
jgi:dethiobiotin synthetase